ncbi:MAG: hypothetical protein BWY99_02486 [Synergistetes bacterium ADurb.BinA166]|nr:MAG: hypothetical protein BWY99_02486 [Synergistetes bacterium ADurb.BinA166]
MSPSMARATRYATPAAENFVWPYGRAFTCMYGVFTSCETWWSMITTLSSARPRSSRRFCCPAPRSAKTFSESSCGMLCIISGSSCRTKTGVASIPARVIACIRIERLVIPSASMCETTVTRSASRIIPAAADTSLSRLI